MSTSTVLVVDDEDDLREIMCYILQRRGFTTLAAPGPNEALELSHQHHGSIDALVTDLALRGAKGSELAAMLSSERPRMGVLYVSGWTREVAVSQGLVDERATVVQKPFTPDQLVEAVTASLEAALAPSGGASGSGGGARGTHP